MSEPIDPKDEIIASLQEQLRQANERTAHWTCKYHADENLFNRQNRELIVKDATIDILRQALMATRHTLGSAQIIVNAALREGDKG